MKAIEAYPLSWPPGRDRTPAIRRKRALFHKREERRWTNSEGKYTVNAERSVAQSVRALREEVERLGGTRLVISSNVELRRDGLPMSGRRQPEDPGAAAYFTFDNRPVAFACDRWDRVSDNLYAIAKTIEALRGIDRWGSGDAMRAAFTGFRQLGDGRKPWREVLGFEPGSEVREEEVDRKFDGLLRKHHPDKGGDPSRMAEINAARDAAREEFRRAQS